MTFSSQLAAIADAHMGTSSVMGSSDSMATSNPLASSSPLSLTSSQATMFQLSLDSLPTHQLPASQPLSQSLASSQQLLSHFNSLRQQQQQALQLQQLRQTAPQTMLPSPRPLPPLSLEPSSHSTQYLNHPSQATLPMLAQSLAMSQSHPLQPQNFNRFISTSSPSEMFPHQPQFSEPGQNASEQCENAFPADTKVSSLQNLAALAEHRMCSPCPPVNIDPNLVPDYEFFRVDNAPLANAFFSDPPPPVPPPTDLAGPKPAVQPSEQPPPRRTRSAAAALLKQNKDADAGRKVTSAQHSPASSRPVRKSAGMATAPAAPAESPAAPTSAVSPSTRESPVTDNSVAVKSNGRSDAEGTPASSGDGHTKPTDPYDRKAWKTRLSIVRSELDHILKTPSRAASKLVKILSAYRAENPPASGDWSLIPPDGRTEVLSAIRASANKDFYSAWAHESKGLGLDMLEAWVKGAVHAYEKPKPQQPAGDKLEREQASQRDSLLLLLLQMLEKLPITVDNLKRYNFAKLVLRINKQAANGQKFPDKIKRLSDSLEQTWRANVRGAGSSAAKTTASTTPAAENNANHTSSVVADTKKRHEPSPEPTQIKKRKVEITNRVGITPSTSSANKQSPDSLFGRPDKSKLPAFTKKKAEPPAPAAVPAPAVQDPFAQALAEIQGRNANSCLGDAVDAAPSMTKKINGKPARRVKFAPDHELCQVKIVERLVYEGEEYEIHPVGDARKMDAIEGRYLHHGDDFLEEEMEWETPLEVVLTAETIFNLETSPLVSTEAQVQEEREKAIGEVTGDAENPEIVETPREPAEGEAGATGGAEDPGLPRVMKLGGDLLHDPEVPRMIARAQADTSVNAPVATDNTVSDLLARLMPQASGQMHNLQLPVGSDPNQMLPPGFDMELLNSISQGGSVRALFTSSGNQGVQVPPVSEPYPTAKRDNGWGAAAGSARAPQRDPTDPQMAHMSGGHTGASRSKRGRKKGREGHDQRPYLNAASAYDSHGNHIPCKWWPCCPYGGKCYYKHG